MSFRPPSPLALPAGPTLIGRLKAAARLLPHLYLVIVAVWLRLVNLGYSDYIGDESSALWRPAPGQTSLAYLFTKTKGPVEFLVTLLVRRLDPDYQDRYLARLPFALAGLLAIYFFYRLARLHYGNKIALYATLFLATNGLFVGLFRLVQYQAFVVLFTILALYCLSLAVRVERWRITGLYLGLICWSAALFTHYDGIFIAPFALYSLFQWYRLRAEIPASARRQLIVLACLAAGLPLLAYYLPLLQHLPAQSKGYLLSRVAAVGDTSLLPSSVRNFNLYNSILAIYLYTALGAISLGRPKRAALPLAWFAFGWVILELFVYEPGTHIYNYILPATLLAALGMQALEQLARRLLGENPGRIFNTLWVAATFLSLAAISHLIFIDHTPEYPLEERRILFWTIGGIEEGYLLRMFGFPYYRRWDDIGAYVGSRMRSGYYTTNEDEKLARYYLPYTMDPIQAGYFI